MTSSKARYNVDGAGACHAESASVSDVIYSSHEAELEMNRKKRSENWTDEETFILISLWKEFVDDLRACKRNRKIYAKMVDRLKEAGVRKTVENVKTKLQNLTTAYRKENARMETGSSSCSTWKFWVLLDAILGHHHSLINDNGCRTMEPFNPSSVSGSSAQSRQVLLRLRRRRPNYDSLSSDNMVTDNLHVQLEEDSQPIEPWEAGASTTLDESNTSTTAAAATSDDSGNSQRLLRNNNNNNNNNSSNGNNVDNFIDQGTGEQMKTRKRRRRAVKNVSDELLEEAKRGNDILENMERATLEIFKEVIAGQKQALELQNRSLNLQEALVNGFLRSQNLPPLDTSK